MTETKDVWQFGEMIDAAIYGATEDRDIDQYFEGDDDFANSAYEVYLVIERRLRENESFWAFGIPSHGKEKRVKNRARQKYEEGFESEDQNMKELYDSVPASSGDSRKPFFL